MTIRELLAEESPTLRRGITKLTIQMNGLKIEPKDPFLIGRSTVFQADEKFMIEGYPVEVSSFMLPHVSNLTKKEKAALGGTEGLTKDQGFYIYRNKRLLVWGTWFRMHRKDELSKLARIRRGRRTVRLECRGIQRRGQRTRPYYRCQRIGHQQCLRTGGHKGCYGE